MVAPKRVCVIGVGASGLAAGKKHAEHKNLYFIGLFQPLGCFGPLADYQTRLACAEIRGDFQRPAGMPAGFQHEIDHPHFKFSAGLRHLTQIDYHSLRDDLKVELKKGLHRYLGPPQGVVSKYKRTLPIASNSLATSQQLQPASP